uniref:Uncharacterized protein n=1 Tax=Anguilla anguilla TaxID=7936 RepID=A0A0E9QV29_ANGAN
MQSKPFRNYFYAHKITGYTQCSIYKVQLIAPWL